MTWAAGRTGGGLSTEGESSGAWEAGGRGPAPSEPARCPPAPGGRREAGAQPVAHAPCWAEPRKVPLRPQSPSAQKAAPPAGLAASLHSALRSRRLAPAGRGVRSRGAPGAKGTRAVQVLGLPLGGTAARCAWLRSAGTLATERSTARPGTGREAARSGRPKARAGWRRVPRAPRPFSESPRGLRGPRISHPSQAAAPLVLGECGRVGLGPGAGLGADPEAGLSLRQDPARLPSVSLLSLLLPPPAPGGARHGGAGVWQARYGSVEIGEAWCGEVEWGKGGAGRIGGLRDGETPGSRTRGRGGVPMNPGPLGGEGDEAGQVWNRHGRERTAVRRGAWEER